MKHKERERERERERETCGNIDPADLLGNVFDLALVLLENSHDLLALALVRLAHVGRGRRKVLQRDADVRRRR